MIHFEARRAAAIELENRAIASAYYGESFARTKRLKPLASYLLNSDGSPKGKTNQTPDDMLQALKDLEAGGAAMTFKFIPNEDNEGEG